MKYFSTLIEATPEGRDKIGMMTGAFVLSNTLANITTHLANVVEANMHANMMLVNGATLRELTVNALLESFDLPFEREALVKELAQVDPTSSVSEAMKYMTPMARLYLLMATPKKDPEDAGSDILETPLDE
jgi:hypothetical protein